MPHKHFQCIPLASMGSTNMLPVEVAIQKSLGMNPAPEEPFVLEELLGTEMRHAVVVFNKNNFTNGLDAENYDGLQDLST